MHSIKNMLFGAFLFSLNAESFLVIIGFLTVLAGFILSLYGFWHDDKE